MSAADPEVDTQASDSLVPDVLHFSTVCNDESKFPGALWWDEWHPDFANMSVQKDIRLPLMLSDDSGWMDEDVKDWIRTVNSQFRRWQRAYYDDFRKLNEINCRKWMWLCLAGSTQAERAECIADWTVKDREAREVIAQRLDRRLLNIHKRIREFTVRLYNEKLSADYVFGSDSE